MCFCYDFQIHFRGKPLKHDDEEAMEGSPENIYIQLLCDV